MDQCDLGRLVGHRLCVHQDPRQARPLTFTGREVLYVAPKTTASGYAKVYADGKLIGRFNLRASSTQLGRIITSKKWGSSGAHTMRVVNDQSGRRTNVDAFIVLK